MPLRNIYLIVLGVSLSLICYQRADSTRRTEYRRMFEVFARAMGHIEDDYIQPQDREKLFEGALKGMVAELDEYSAYYDPESYRQVRESLDQEFGGIGIQVTLDEETKELMVMSPLVGTPAYQAGVLAGDRILAINGHETEGFTLDDAVEKLRGKIGESVTLKLQHVGQKESHDLTMKRETIQVETVHGDTRAADDSWDYFIEGADKIGYVRISSFGERTTEELQAALTWLQQRERRGLVLDLRNNPGGLLETARQVCDLFLKEGIIVSTRGRDGVTESVYQAAPGGIGEADVPIVVLVNRFSASASEIVSACLQDHWRAIVMGERTWGKGSVQHIIELRTGIDALKITTSTYWRPSGRNIHRLKNAKDTEDWGVSPNEGYQLKLDTEELRELLRYRRFRDVALGSVATAPDEAPNWEPRDPRLPLEVDRQLRMAVDYLEETLRKKSSSATETTLQPQS